MPELPEVESIMRSLQPIIEHRVVTNINVTRMDLREPLPPDFANYIVNNRVVGLRRRGKYMIWLLENNYALIVHLGMSGRLLSMKLDAIPKHTHVMFEFENKDYLGFCDPRRFGLLKVVPTAELEHSFQNLGPEPLEAEFNLQYLKAKLTRKKQPIKEILLDQKIISGLGNIYVSESLYYAQIHPLSSGASLNDAQITALIKAVRQVLHTAITAGGSTLKDYMKPSGERGAFQDQFAVYSKEGESCPDCAISGNIKCKIRRIVQGGRATFYCDFLQHMSDEDGR